MGLGGGSQHEGKLPLRRRVDGDIAGSIVDCFESRAGHEGKRYDRIRAAVSKIYDEAELEDGAGVGG